MLEQGQICACFSHFSLRGLGVCLPMWCHCVGKGSAEWPKYQRNSCDSVVLLLSIPFPLHSCNSFHLHSSSYSGPQGQWFQSVSHFSFLVLSQVVSRESDRQTDSPLPGCVLSMDDKGRKGRTAASKHCNATQSIV